MGKTKIVHVYKDFWPPILGGIERTINWMIGGLLEEDYEFTILVNSRTRETKEREWNGVRIIEVGEWGRKFSAPISPAFPLWLKKLKADIWHFHLPNPTGDVSYLLTRPKGKVVATYHSDIIRQKWAMGLYSPFLKAFLKRCDVIMPTSPRLIDSSPLLSAFREKCHPVPLGMPLAPFERTVETATRSNAIKRKYKGYPILIFVGKLRYYKGLQYLISAMRALPRVHLMVIGDGPEGPRLKQLAKDLKVKKNIHFLGELPDKEMNVHLQAADIFVMPSHLPSEAFGLSMVEAMASGLPVVCCDLATGVPYVNKDNLSGRVVKPASDKALAEGIRDILDDPNKKFRLGEGALRRANELFSQEAMCKNLKEVYEGLIKG